MCELNRMVLNLGDIKNIANLLIAFLEDQAVGEMYRIVSPIKAAC